MKVSFIKEDAKDTLKANVEVNAEFYANATSDWVEEFIGENPFIEYKKTFEDFDFDMTYEKPTEADYINAMKLHTALKDLSRSDATDERFWVGLAHNECWKFMSYRYRKDVNRTNPESILNRYFFKSGQARALFTSTLPRMWWVAEILYDSENNNPYWLLDFFKNDFGTKVLMVFSNNFNNNSNIIKGVIKAFFALEKEGVSIGREIYYDAFRHLNIIGGNSLLDYFSEDEIYKIVYDRYAGI